MRSPRGSDDALGCINVLSEVYEIVLIDGSDYLDERSTVATESGVTELIESIESIGSGSFEGDYVEDAISSGIVLETVLV
jgi:hypothetical protein